MKYINDKETIDRILDDIELDLELDTPIICGTLINNRYTIQKKHYRINMYKRDDWCVDGDLNGENFLIELNPTFKQRRRMNYIWKKVDTIYNIQSKTKTQHILRVILKGK